MWFWLAKIIRGNNQHVKTSRGVDKLSVAMAQLIKFQPGWAVFFNQERLSKAIIRL